MSKLNSAARIPDTYRRSDLIGILAQIDAQVNAVSEGRITGSYNAQSVIPSGSATQYAKGDFVPNLNVSVMGSAGSQYVLRGWVCVSAPGSFAECRNLTGT